MDDKIIGEGKLNEGVIRERKRELNELAVEPEISLNAEVFLDSVRITGVKVNYYHICKTKLWLFSHNINLEKENDSVAIGKMLHEDRYKKNYKNITIDGISIDFVKAGKILEIHEIKKSKRMDAADKAQLSFYLYYLKKKGFEATGVLNYPLLNKVERIELSPEDEIYIERDIEDIRKIVLGSIPSPERKKICLKCAYQEFCFCGENSGKGDDKN
ncbi:CRISPR-associated protein Cas4 [Methanosarcina thermophila MST-A1]|uniref:CRISPR-associated exonuclease Cas4 n=1 Tax=Methanosarcina thermophila TaxID=2210 RepID=A0A3G9CX10_METTE|nr:CRISPR-associated protein Cas4 [Methanosarcina thermophila]BAW29291.1 CRISPR-associated exonuclease, Cas4 family [Methanosarcina thermophila]GLI13649.1 CRISPR-associated protein Cas4 [Methanosarcina thermophila MST-A1]